MKCDLCENPAMHIHAKCHITAPLRAEIEDNKLSIYCYACSRHVASFYVFERIDTDETTITVSISD